MVYLQLPWQFNPLLLLHVHLCLHPTAVHAHDTAAALYKRTHKCGINCRRSFAGCLRETLCYGSAERRAAVVSHLPLSISPSLPPSSPRPPAFSTQPYAAHRTDKIMHSQFCLFVWVSPPFPPLHWCRRRMSGCCPQVLSGGRKRSQATDYPTLTALQKEMNINGSNYSRHLAFLTRWPLYIKQPL